MKSASAATLANLASGQCLRADLYTITPLGGSAYRFTTADVPLSVGGNIYGTGLLFKRGSYSLRVGLEVPSLELTITPQPDAAGGPPTIGGQSILTAARMGILDGAAVVWNKLFLSSWDDTSPGATPWFVGEVGDVKPGRMSAVLTVTANLQRLNVQMPRNIIQTGCGHALFDSGCTLSRASFLTSSAVTGTVTPSVLAFSTGLSSATDYFALGRIDFTSGVNAGISRTVKSYSFTNGLVTLINPLPSAPSAADTFTISPGCDKQQATCSSKFSNLPHFSGKPYVPVPETIYGGATMTGSAPTAGGQGGPVVGSPTDSDTDGQNTRYF